MRSANRCARAIALGVLLVALPQAGPARAGEADPQTRAAMHEIFEALRRALPLSLNDGRFRDPAHRDEILAALTALSNGASQLEVHGRDLDASFSFLSRALARNARDVLRRYERGEIRESRFLLQHLTETCVGCHSRLPSDRAHPLGQRLVRRVAVQRLPLPEKARLQMATRQFDEARDTYEAIFASPEVLPAEMDLMGYFDDYLEVSIRVRQDLKRPIPVFEALSLRSDFPDYLRAPVSTWIASLRELRGREATGSALERGRALLAEADDRTRFPDERLALVHYVMASSLLHQYVSSQPSARPDVAEAYYLLGVIESRIGHAAWLSQTELFLETSIRMGPGEPFARPALALLEEFLVAGYTGSAGARVPTEVRELLEELRRLIDGSGA